jgi:putative DNA methylase
MKKPTNKPSKRDRLLTEIADLVGAGKRWDFESVDFSDPNRPLTCLEVDFPIVPINEIAQIEGNAGKPIYQMSKWWARRRSSVFRAMLLAAATKAPEIPAEAAAKIWRAYYGNHQNNPAFKSLKVADLFMGGGTTLVEGSRLGMNLFGCDLNPVAWFVVKNEITPVDLDEVKQLLAEIEAEVKPFLMPYFACNDPDGEHGVWFKRDPKLEGEWERLGADFDIFGIPWQERPLYRYEGPEIIYTFWAKHGPCMAQDCGHLTPLLTSPVVAIKTLTVDFWGDYECLKCAKTFDVERHSARMAPRVTLVVADGEKAFSAINERGEFTCPHCDHAHVDRAARINGESVSLGGKAKKKKVELTLLMHPEWMKGCDPVDADGLPLGGSATDDSESTIRWLRERAKPVRCIEVRGSLPEIVTCPETGLKLSTSAGNLGTAGNYVCQEPTCGRKQKVVEAIEKTGKTGPFSPYVIQAYSSAHDKAGYPYGGRFFATAHESERYVSAVKEWGERSEQDLKEFWPRSEIPFGHMTHQRQPLAEHGYTHWWKMFNPLQLLVHTQLLKSISDKVRFAESVREAALGAFQQFLRSENMFCFWHISHDHFAPFLSNNNFHPKSTVIEVGAFCPVGYGPWGSCRDGVIEGLAWMQDVHELASEQFISRQSAVLGEEVKSKSIPIKTLDPAVGPVEVFCQSSTDLKQIASGSLDLVITDPPFGGLLHYSELSDFFYVWLRLVLKDRYPVQFGPEYTPKALEAVANKARQEDPDAFYRQVLTDCWREAHRILKPGGLLAFTFHHSEDEPWVDVLESLFSAGFYLEATYPIRSDETKGEGEFGSKQVEYDIIHVCRKRMEEPTPVSWAKLRRQLAADVRQITHMLEHHRQEGLPEADLKVIRRGKALEYFSKHYGKIFIERDKPIDLKVALAGINQLLDDDAQSAPGDAPPSLAEPLTRQFLRIFKGGEAVLRDAIQKELRGTGIGPDDFEKKGWCSEDKKVFYMVDPHAWATDFKGVSRQKLSRDLDQALFLMGANYEGSEIRVRDTLTSPNFKHHPAIPDLLDWFVRKGASREMRDASHRALTLYRAWMEEHKEEVDAQMTLFDLEGLD